MIQTRRIVMPVAAVAILAAVLTLPAMPAHAAPEGPAGSSFLASLWQPLADGLAGLEAGVGSLFGASGTDGEPNTGTEIGVGADPNGIQAAPDLDGSATTPSHEPDTGN